MFTLFLHWIFSRLSRMTLLFALFIVSAAAYLRQLMDFVLAGLDTGDAGPFVWACFALMGAGVLWLLRPRGARRSRLTGLIPPALIFAAGLLFALNLELAVERVHLVFFGVLGFMAARDSTNEHPAVLLPVWFFCVAIAALDEFFQYFLPYRVGDPRDVLFGALGGFWGLTLQASSRLGA